jgi:hypothetical protein
LTAVLSDEAAADESVSNVAIAVQTDIPYVHHQLRHRGETMNHRSSFGTDQSLSSHGISSQSM